MLFSHHRVDEHACLSVTEPVSTKHVSPMFHIKSNFTSRLARQLNNVYHLAIGTWVKVSSSVLDYGLHVMVDHDSELWSWGWAVQVAWHSREFFQMWGAACGSTAKRSAYWGFLLVTLDPKASTVHRVTITSGKVAF